MRMRISPWKVVIVAVAFAAGLVGGYQWGRSRPMPLEEPVYFGPSEEEVVHRSTWNHPRSLEVAK